MGPQWVSKGTFTMRQTTLTNLFGLGHNSDKLRVRRPLRQPTSKTLTSANVDDDHDNTTTHSSLPEGPRALLELLEAEETLAWHAVTGSPFHLGMGIHW